MLRKFNLSKSFKNCLSTDKTLKSEFADFFKHISPSNENKKIIQSSVQEILENVKTNGDNAICEYALKFDKITLNPSELIVTEKEINDSEKFLSFELKKAIEQASVNIRLFHENQNLKDIKYDGPDGEILEVVHTPIERVGLYVPGGAGGKTPLVSTLLMNAIPALIAGAKEIVIVSPPTADKSLSPIILYAMKSLGLKKAFKVGGAQAIGALAYGTDTIPKVDIIVGPGNSYVAAAKKEVFGDVAIDGVFGPSEIAIISDGYSYPAWTAADLISQSEHAGGELSLLITPDEAFADKVLAELEKQVEVLPRKEQVLSSFSSRGAIAIVPDLETAVMITNAIAPEHLELAVEEPDLLRPLVTQAGAVFLGEKAPEPIGDYVCGTNHVLPTNGSARFASPLGVYTFLKRTNYIKYTTQALAKNGPHAVTLATAEGLDGHANSVLYRLGYM